MLALEEIQEWWDRNINNYLKNYARRNGLFITEARERFFTKSHKDLIESILIKIKKFID